MGNLYIGELASLGAALIWAGSVSLYRGFGGALRPEVLNLCNCSLASLCFVITALCLGLSFPTDLHVWLMLGASGLIGLALGDTAFYASLRSIGAQMSSALQALSPAFTAAIAYCYLGETLSPIEIFGMIITTVALMLAIKFSQHSDSQLLVVSRRSLVIGVSAGVLSALLQSVGLVIARAALQHVDVVFGSLMRMLPTVVLLGIWFFWRGFDARMPVATQDPPPPIRWRILWLAAFMGSFLGVMLASTGAKFAKAAVSSVLTSTYPVWIIPITWTYFGERSNWQTVLCIIVALCGVALMFI